MMRIRTPYPKKRLRIFDGKIRIGNLRLTGGTSNLALEIEGLVTIVGEELLLLLILLSARRAEPSC